MVEWKDRKIELRYVQMRKFRNRLNHFYELAY